MNWKPNDANMAKLQNDVQMYEIIDKAKEVLEMLNKRKEKWSEECYEEGVSFHDFHKHNVYY